jgi:hypothetical protein
VLTLKKGQRNWPPTRHQLPSSFSLHICRVHMCACVHVLVSGGEREILEFEHR